MDWEPNPCLSIRYTFVIAQWYIDSNIRLLGGIPPYIYGDIGGADRWAWFVSVYSDKNVQDYELMTARFLQTCSVLREYVPSLDLYPI